MRSRSTNVTMFVLAGWLFADLFVGLAIIFLVGGTVGKTTPLPPTPTPIPTATPLPTFTPVPPVPTATPVPPASIDPSDVRVTLTVTDPYNFSQDTAAQQQFVTDLKQQLSAKNALNKRAGIVIITSGHDQGLADQAAAYLPTVGFTFTTQTVFKPLFSQDLPNSFLELDIFFFR